VTDALVSRRKGPERASSALVFLHGYGADGADLLGLAEPLSQVMPETAFYAPDAPEPCTVNPAGRQWFPIPWIDGSDEAAVGRSLAASSERLDAFLDKVLADEGLGPDRLVLLGFSQGTMMSLHVAPRRPGPVAAIVGFSGRLLVPGALAGDATSKPPVMLLHGDADDVVPFASMAEADAALRDAGFDVTCRVMHGVAHGISPDGLQAAVGFILPRLA